MPHATCACACIDVAPPLPDAPSVGMAAGDNDARSIMYGAIAAGCLPVILNDTIIHAHDVHAHAFSPAGLTRALWPTQSSLINFADYFN